VSDVLTEKVTDILTDNVTDILTEKVTDLLTDVLTDKSRLKPEKKVLEIGLWGLPVGTPVRRDEWGVWRTRDGRPVGPNRLRPCQ